MDDRAQTFRDQYIESLKLVPKKSLEIQWRYQALTNKAKNSLKDRYLFRTDSLSVFVSTVKPNQSH